MQDANDYVDWERNKKFSYRKETVWLLRRSVLLAEYNTGRRYFVDIIGIFNHCDVISLQSADITQNQGYYFAQGHLRSPMSDFVGINRKPVYDFLLVINTNWHRISYRYEVITDYCLRSGHFAF